jgi:GPH family glycoside/pentoside/hexuronide:cation symporter
MVARGDDSPQSAMNQADSVNLANRRWPLGTRLAYGVGQLAEGMKNGALGLFVFFYYSQVLGLPATLTGVAVAIALFVDGIVDPLIGSISDNWRSKYGRRHPFMLAAIIPLMIGFFGLFAPPVSGQWALFVWLIVFSNITRAAISAFHVPHLALGAEMSSNPDERATLVGFRMFFSLLGGLCSTMIGFGLYFAPSAQFPVGQLNAAAYAPFAATLSVIMGLAILLTAYGTRSVIPLLRKFDHAASPISVASVFRNLWIDIRTAIASVSFRWLFSGVLVVYLMIGTNGALDIYMFTYFWEFSNTEVMTLSVAYPLGLMLGAILAPRFIRRFDKRVALLFGTVWYAGLQVLPVTLRLLGFFPDNDDAALIPLYMAIRFVHGIGSVMANVGFGAALADIADENEWRSGRRQEGIFFSTSSFSLNFATGIGGLIAGVALDVIDWPRGIAIRSAADVSPDTLVDLGLVYGPFVMAFSLVTLWCYSNYGLTRERHAQIVEELAARRRSLSLGDTNAGREA